MKGACDATAIPGDDTTMAKLENLKDYLVVGTDNGLFICPVLQAQRSKEIAADLEAEKKEVLIDCQNVHVKNKTDIPVAMIECKNIQIELIEYQS